MNTYNVPGTALEASRGLRILFLLPLRQGLSALGLGLGVLLSFRRCIHPPYTALT